MSEKLKGPVHILLALISDCISVPEAIIEIQKWHIQERKKWARKLFPKQVKVKVEGEDILEYGNKIFNQCREEFFRRTGEE